MSKKTKINMDEVLSAAPEVEEAVEEAVDVAMDVAEAISDPAPEPVEEAPKPEPVQVIVTEGPKVFKRKLSARTLAEMERGRRALAERNGT